MTDVRVDKRLLFFKEKNNKKSKIQRYKVQTAVANVQAKIKNMSLHRENKFAM